MMPSRRDGSFLSIPEAHQALPNVNTIVFNIALHAYNSKMQHMFPMHIEDQ